MSSRSPYPYVGAKKFGGKAWPPADFTAPATGAPVRLFVRLVVEDDCWSCAMADLAGSALAVVAVAWPADVVSDCGLLFCEDCELAS